MLTSAERVRGRGAEVKHVCRTNKLALKSNHIARSSPCNKAACAKCYNLPVQVKNKDSLVYDLVHTCLDTHGSLNVKDNSKHSAEVG